MFFRGRVVIALAAAIGSGVTCAPAAFGAFPGAPGQLTYTSLPYDPSSKSQFATLPSQVLTINPDGLGQTVIEGGAGIDYFEPTYSPDGRSIAFSVYGRGRGNGHVSGLFVTTGGDVRQVSPDATVGASAWSPDGKQLVYDARGGLYVVGSGGTGLRRLLKNTTGTQAFTPAYTADGKGILYTKLFTNKRGQGINQQIWWVSSSGANAHRVLGGSGELTNAQQADPSPDGATFVFTANNGRSGNALRSALFISDNDGKKVTKLTAAPGGRYFNGPAFSPDGRHVVASQVARGTRRGSEIDVVDTGTGELTPIKKTTKGLLFFASWQSVPSVYAPSAARG